MVPQIDQEMNDFEHLLRSLRPSAAGLSSDRLIFEMGLRRGRRSRGSLLIPWSVAALSLCLSIVLDQSLRVERRRHHELSTAVEAQARRSKQLEGEIQAVVAQIQTYPRSSDSFARLRASWYTGAPPSAETVSDRVPITVESPPRSLPLSPRRPSAIEL